MRDDCETDIDTELGTVYCLTHDQYICRGCHEHFVPIFGHEKSCQMCKLGGKNSGHSPN